MYEKLISKILKLEKPTSKKINQLKLDFCKENNSKEIVKNPRLISFCKNNLREKLIEKLNIKPIRELSGVSVLALFSKPHSCPHGKCIYCPGGPNSEFGDTPQSYIGKEPAAQRAIRNNFDPYLQVFNRMEHYVLMGHIPDKLEVIFMGGTFPSLDKKYKDEFVRLTYKAINDFGKLFIQNKKITKSLNIGIDVDDCLIKTNIKKAVSLYNKKYKKNTMYEEMDIYNFENKEIEKIFFEVHNKNMLKNKIQKNAKKVLKNFKKKKHSLNIITSRSKLEYKNTIKWIDTNFEKNFFNEAIFTFQYNHNKKHLLAKEKKFDIVIDDAPHHLEGYKKNTKAKIVIFDRPWNKNIKEDNKRIFRINNFLDFEKIVNKFSKTNVKKIKWEKFIDFFELKNEKLDFDSKKRQEIIHKKCLKLKKEVL